MLTIIDRKDNKRSPRAVRTETLGESMTEQSHKNSCDIKQIMRKADKTGMIAHVKRTEGKYVDLVNRPDFHTSMNEITEAQSMFETIPSGIRAKFDNDPGKWLKFVTNEENRAEMTELGFDTSHLPEVLVEPSPVKVIVQNTQPAE